MSTKTPLTDAFVLSIIRQDDNLQILKTRDFARDLELKLAAMTKERDELKQHGEVIISIEQEKSAKLRAFLLRCKEPDIYPEQWPTTEEWVEVLKE